MTINFSHESLPNISLTGKKMYIFHGIGLSCSILSLVCICMIFLILCSGRTSFFKKPMHERLIFYMAIMDGIYGINFTYDRSYSIITGGDFPPEAICTTIGFFGFYTACMQNLLVMLAAINAFIMVVEEKKLWLGKYDFRLFVFVFIIPLLLSLHFAYFGFFGKDGFWCLISSETYASRVFRTFTGFIPPTVFLIALVCYVVIWVKLTQKRRCKNLNLRKGKYDKTAKIMTFIVAAFLVQWFMFVIYAVYGLFYTPPYVIALGTMMGANSGGVPNLIATKLMTRYVKKPRRDISINEQASSI